MEAGMGFLLALNTWGRVLLRYWGHSRCLGGPQGLVLPSVGAGVLPATAVTHNGLDAPGPALSFMI